MLIQSCLPPAPTPAPLAPPSRETVLPLADSPVPGASWDPVVPSLILTMILGLALRGSMTRPDGKSGWRRAFS